MEEKEDVKEVKEWSGGWRRSPTIGASSPGHGVREGKVLWVYLCPQHPGEQAPGGEEEEEERREGGGERRRRGEVRR